MTSNESAWREAINTPAIERATSPREAYSARGQLVVVLDEDDSVFDEVAKPLEDAGYLVLPISTAEGIVDELKVTLAAALLLDLRSNASEPGPDVLTQLAQDAELRSMPVLVYSDDAEALQTLAPQLAARGHGILQRPLDIGDVLIWLGTYVS